MDSMNKIQTRLTYTEDIIIYIVDDGILFFITQKLNDSHGCGIRTAVLIISLTVVYHDIYIYIYIYI
jgi:hypothetical protein